jgi:hypothetical protein
MQTFYSLLIYLTTHRFWMALLLGYGFVRGMCLVHITSV